MKQDSLTQEIPPTVGMTKASECHRSNWHLKFILLPCIKFIYKWSILTGKPGFIYW